MRALAGDGDLKAALAQHPVLCVGRTTCAFSLEAAALLADAAASLGAPARAALALWTDELREGAALRAALKADSGCATQPVVYIGGEFVGGCDAVKAMQRDGLLRGRVAAALQARGVALGGESADAKDAGFHAALDPATAPAFPGVLWFPEVVDSNAVRFTATGVVACCIVLIIWRERSWAKWMALGLTADNLLRFCFGPGPSPLGQLARVPAAFFSPHFGPGLPKQFATACALFMSAVATIFLFLSGFDSQEIIPACFLAVYAALAFLEGSVDFCMGCWMFSWLYRFGLVPATAYSLAIAAKPEAAYGYAEAEKVVALAPAKPTAFTPPGRTPSPLDLHHKARKLDDYERQNSSVLRHAKITHSLAPLGFAGLALLWTAAADAPALGVGLTVSKVFAAAAAVVLLAFTLLYAAKAALKPRRVAKEWMCPMRSNVFVVPPLCLVVLAACVAGYSSAWLTTARVLFWIGAPAGLAVGLLLAARHVADRRSIEHVSPAWLLPAMGALVAAALGPGLYADDADVVEAMWLWMGFGVTMWLLTFAMTWQRVVLNVEADDRQRSLAWAWVAAPALAALAVAALTGDFGPLAKTLFFSALSLALALGVLFVQGYSSRGVFDPAFSWAYAFPVEALAVAAVRYSAAVPGAFTEGMAYCALALASGATAVLALQTLRELILRRVFVADAKYGPLSQQVLTHEAFRGAIPRLLAALDVLDPSRPAPAVAADFARQFRRFAAAHTWHAAHEEQVLFKTFEDYFPGVAQKYSADHAADGPKLAAWADAVAALEAGGAGWAPALATLRAELPAFTAELAEHLIGEETELQPVGRKHVPIDVQKEVMRKIFEMTPATVLADFFPWCVSNMPLTGQRVKFCRCWLWAVPERAQQIGAWLALGLDAPTWARLTAQVPEIVPRGAPGWKKYG